MKIIRRWLGIDEVLDSNKRLAFQLDDTANRIEGYCDDLCDQLEAFDMDKLETYTNNLKSFNSMVNELKGVVSMVRAGVSKKPDTIK